eukprot:761161-Hanusia_phi.AAC.1
MAGKQRCPCGGGGADGKGGGGGEDGKGKVERIIFSCLHSACNNCAPEALEWSSRYGRCPQCSAASRSFVGAEVEELLELYEQTAGEERLWCIECSLEAAERFCESCGVNLCGKCFALTHDSKLFRQHKVSSPRCSERRPLPRCSSHPSERVCFIAKDRGTLHCRDCVLLDPKFRLSLHAGGKRQPLTSRHQRLF